MSDAPLLVRGAPRYLHGPAAGPAGPLSLIPEIRVDPDGTVRPAALLVIRPAGVERYPIGAAGRASGGPVQTAPRHPPVPPEPLPEAPDPTSTIVPGAEAPAEDPRVAAVFGPIRGSGPTLRLPLAAILPGVDGGPPARHPAGTIYIRAGTVRVRLIERRGLAPRVAATARALLRRANRRGRAAAALNRRNRHDRR